MAIRMIEDKPEFMKFEVVGESHGFCNVLRRILIEDEYVVFAGYSLDHPLLSNPIMSIRTQNKLARDALKDALEKLIARSNEFSKKFEEAVESFEAFE